MTATKEQCNQVRDLLDKALAEIADATGLVYKPIGRMTYGDSVKCKIELLAGEPGKIESMEDVEKRAFENYAWHFNLKPNDYGRTFTVKGKAYRITGIKPRRRKYPITAVRVSDNAPFKFPIEAVRSSLAPQTADC